MIRVGGLIYQYVSNIWTSKINCDITVDIESLLWVKQMTNFEGFADRPSAGSRCEIGGKPGTWQNGRCVPNPKSAEDNDFNLLSSENDCSPSLQAEDEGEPFKLELGESCTDRDGKPGIWENGNCNTGDSAKDNDFDLLNLENDRSPSLPVKQTGAHEPLDGELGESCTDKDGKPGTLQKGQCVPNN